MNPIIASIEKDLIKSPLSNIFKYIGASNIPSEFYNNIKLNRIWALAPYSDNYYSILNPLFSKIYLELTKKGHHYPVVLLRDGALDLFEFVVNNPDPLKFDQKFIIHQSLSFILPEIWLKNVILFDYFHQPKGAYRLEMIKKRLIVSTIVNNAFISSKQALEHFNLLKDFASKNNLEVLLHLPIRENHYFTTDYKDQNAAFDLSLIAFDVFGSQTKFISDKLLKSSSDYRDSYYALIPNNFLCLSDNYIEHHFLMNGSTPWKSYRDIQGAFKVSLSAQHGVYLFDALDEHFKSSKFAQILKFWKDHPKSSDLTNESLTNEEFFNYLCDHSSI